MTELCRVSPSNSTGTLEDIPLSIRECTRLERDAGTQHIPLELRVQYWISILSNVGSIAKTFKRPTCFLNLTSVQFHPCV